MRFFFVNAFQISTGPFSIWEELGKFEDGHVNLKENINFVRTGNSL